MKSRVALMIGAAVAMVLGMTWLCGAADQGRAKKKILFYSESDGFPHSVVVRPLTGEIAFAEKIFKEIATKAGYEVYLSQSFHDLENENKFNQYDAVVFYTTGDPKIDRKSLFKWLRSGKAFIGIHAATDTFKSDPEYVKMVGGSFKTHGAGDRKVTITIEDRDHPATRMLPAEWVIADEIYQMNDFSKDNVHMLMSIDTEKTDLRPQNMKKGEYYPVAYTRTEGKGKVFYTSLGHREDVWTHPLYQQHLMAGVAWALGEAKDKASQAEK
ncbi:MAG: ThuA domain-containing protein [Phycisphaerae bacterium]|nr:ThuA domain-containing protein [Phycisphaerae bacterium]